MGTFSWIIWSGTECHHKCPYKRRAERDLTPEEGHVTIGAERFEEAVMEEGKKCISRGGKSEDMDSP